MASLSCELTEAQQKQEELALALATTQQAMELYQDTARRDVRVKMSSCNRNDQEIRVNLTII